VFAIGQIAINIAFVIYDGILPHVATAAELDRVSTAGYAIGYVGGGILLLLDALMILSPETFGLADKGQATKAAFVSVAVWWLLFSWPFFRKVKEPPTSRRDRVVWWRQRRRRPAKTALCRFAFWSATTASAIARPPTAKR
jgi:MFS-type transporter involved in bile tolerance (Atg22 family)